MQTRYYSPTKQLLGPPSSRPSSPVLARACCCSDRAHGTSIAASGVSTRRCKPVSLQSPILVSRICVRCPVTVGRYNGRKMLPDRLFEQWRLSCHSISNCVSERGLHTSLGPMLYAFVNKPLLQLPARGASVPHLDANNQVARMLSLHQQLYRTLRRRLVPWTREIKGIRDSRRPS